MSEVTELEFNPETAPLEELKARANTAATEPEQKRNADGTFAPKTVLEAIQNDPAEHENDIKFTVGDTFTEDGKDYKVTAVDANGQVTESEEDVDEEFVVTKTVDLKDGSGVQVFTGTGPSKEDALEDLTNKLVTAQENATRKIRQMAASNPRGPQKKERTAEEEFMLSQEFMTKPSKAFEKMFQESVGMPISEFKSTADAVKAFNSGRVADAAAEKFIEITPDYFPNKSNGTKVQNYLKTYNLPATIENLTRAYTDLKDSGLLQSKPAPQTPTTPTTVTQETPVTPVTPTVRPRQRSSGMRPNGGAALAIKKASVTQADFEAETAGMSLEQIRALAMSQTHVARDPHDF